ncbi:DUF711 family protein [Methylomonas sp. SURF-1]|uniref:DUF711 family protein n=1 Tax=Methylomonas aurea TaxID=2952224 RepID=A0ABT1UH26_9GAMM|nr:DUF711 family protein [Methylomonas sp. SURF-1]MCQ8181524.1 DUF711 family protein [Methylomonas sp. SURF-1]
MKPMTAQEEFGTRPPSPVVRTVTLGLNLDPDQPERGAEAARRFFGKAGNSLAESGLRARCFRLAGQPLDRLLQGRRIRANAAAEFAVRMENALGDIWFCMPGPFFVDAADDPELLALVPAVIGATRHVFMNTLVSSAAGMHRGALRRAAAVVRELAMLDQQHQANFRFAVMSNVQANTPFFPASWHQGEAGFSIALELSELANAAFSQPLPFDEKLALFRNQVRRAARDAAECAEALAAETGVGFRGIDFSLAPYPGEDTSAVSAIEALAGSPVGSFQFLFSLYAVNNLLKQGLADFPQVGYNGTMLSVLEDSHLARAVGNGSVDVKDLLLYSTVCGCGLDMVPLALDVGVGQIAALIEAICTEAIKWNKPLITRLLPSSVGANGETNFNHPFIVNTRPIALNRNAFAPANDSEAFFDPRRWAPTALPA